MDTISDPAVPRVVIMSSSQVGKTEILLNTIGFYAVYDPAPILCLQPTLSMAQAFSKDRLSPMIRDTKTLSERVQDPRSRDSGNTTLHKVYTGGHISIAGSNSSASLASRPIRILLCDEIDRYPLSAGTEGDPISLAQKRTQNFINRKTVMVSTPTIRGASRIESAFENSDQRYFYVPCEDCGEFQTLVWQNVQWPKSRPNAAAYVCGACGTAWGNAQRLRSLRVGVWRSTKPYDGIAGFFLNGLYSPWISLGEAAKDFLEAKKLPETLRVFINTYLAETYEEEGEGLESVFLEDRQEEEDWRGLLPENVVLLTMGVDCQKDRFEYEIVGWGREEESWSIDYGIIYGDPSGPKIWDELDVIIKTQYKHPMGVDLPIRCCCIDSGGHYTQSVYNFVRPREGRRVFAIKGGGGEGRALMGRPSTSNIGKIRLFPVGVDTAKELFYSRLKIADFGPGYCHFPQRDTEYFKQLSSEKIVTKYYKGRPRREWVKTRTRNEALDVRVYATAAFALLNTNINHLVDRFHQRLKTRPPEQNEPAQPLRPRPRRRTGQSFVNSWNK